MYTEKQIKRTRVVRQNLARGEVELFFASTDLTFLMAGQSSRSLCQVLIPCKNPGHEASKCKKIKDLFPWFKRFLKRR
jgi:hypothetical protein